MDLFVSQITITKTSKNNLFYSKYKYSATLRTQGAASITRTKSIKYFIDREIRILSRYDYKISKAEVEQKYDIDAIEKFQKYIWELKNSKEIGIRSENTCMNIYTNKVDILEKLYSFNSMFTFLEAIPSPAKTMYFSKEPKFKYRVYLKSKSLVENEYKSAIDIFESKQQEGMLELSVGLRDHINARRSGRFKWLNYNYLSSKYFINYDDEMTLTYLHMVLPNCLGKVYKLEKRPEKVV